MGKNPNAARQKKDHRKGGKNNQDDDDMQSRIEEAAKLGCEVWELDEVKAKMDLNEANSSDEASDEERKDMPEPGQKVKEFGTKQVQQQAEEEDDSSDADEALAAMFGRP